MKQERLTKLEEIGFDWDHPYDAKWEDKFNKLVAYKESMGTVMFLPGKQSLESACLSITPF